MAGLTLQLEADREMAVGKAFEPFLTASDAADLQLVLRQVSTLPPIPEAVLHAETGSRVHPDGKGGSFRSFCDPLTDAGTYAVAYNTHRGVQVEYLEAGGYRFTDLQSAFYHLDLAQLLLSRRRLCIHAACVQTALGGILFSGPSGIGKSTQAKLWCEHRGAVQINGDRPILSREEDGWRAWGSPYAGSSRCHVNAGCPVSAIVMLRRADRCHGRRLDAREAFRAVWSGLTLPRWDAAAMETALDLAAALAAEVPVWEFGCTPDAEAVAYLEQLLRKDVGLCVN